MPSAHYLVPPQHSSQRRPAAVMMPAAPPPPHGRPKQCAHSSDPAPAVGWVTDAADAGGANDCASPLPRSLTAPFSCPVHSWTGCVRCGLIRLLAEDCKLARLSCSDNAHRYDCIADHAPWSRRAGMSCRLVHDALRLQILCRPAAQLTVVCKFGGSSVSSAERMLEVAEIVCSFQDHAPVVVLSAMGKVRRLLLCAPVSLARCPMLACCPSEGRAAPLA